MGLIINVNDHVGRCYSNEDGYVIQNLLRNALKKGGKVRLSFKHIDGVTSSFVNTALIELLNDYSFEDIKNNLSFTDSNSQINGMIKDRFKFEVNRRKKLNEVPV